MHLSAFDDVHSVDDQNQNNIDVPLDEQNFDYCLNDVQHNYVADNCDYDVMDFYD